MIGTNNTPEFDFFKNYFITAEAIAIIFDVPLDYAKAQCELLVKLGKFTKRTSLIGWETLYKTDNRIVSPVRLDKSTSK